MELMMIKILNNLPSAQIVLGAIVVLLNFSIVIGLLIIWRVWRDYKRELKKLDDSNELQHQHWREEFYRRTEWDERS
jgi:hypothetical protein